MKMIFSRYASVLLGSAFLLGSCAPHPQSSKTGMRYNDRYNGGFQVFRKTHPAPGPGLIPIEGGTFVQGGSAGEDVNYEYNNTRKRKSISTFYMDETEVSNTDWREYLYWLQTNFPKDRELYYNAIPDTLVWRSPLSYNEPYVDNYLRGSAFQDYPVVGVSWDQVQDYCYWRTQRMNENILREKGQLVSWKEYAALRAKGDSSQQVFDTEMYLNSQYRGQGIDGKNMMTDLNPNAQGDSASKGRVKRPVRKEDGILRAGYRLPTEAEWEYAALGLAGNTQFENITEGKVYPWNGMGVRSPKAKTRGLMLANFKRTSGDNAGVGGYLNDKADITAPVRSYEPNDFGLYNMAGNVNEWVNDTYRQTSFEESDDFNPFRGNEFTNKQYADPVKGLYAKDKYGKPVIAPATSNKKQTWDEMIAAQKGGTTAATTAETAPASAIAGKAFTPDLRGYGDQVNASLYGVTTLVNDRSKVYKGGSWNDRAYWLNPATRRFMDEANASAEVGFRCAMSNDGPPEINPSGKPEFSIKKQKNFNPKR